MKNRVLPENKNGLTDGASTAPSRTPTLDAVRAEIATLLRTVLEDRAKLDRQRRRVDALLWDGVQATAPRARLAEMERAYALKEIHLHHLIEASGALDHGPRLHSYDIEQRAQRFGVTGAVLQSAVAALGPDLGRVEAALESRRDGGIVAATSMDGVPVTSKGRVTKRRGPSPKQEMEKTHG